MLELDLSVDRSMPAKRTLAEGLCGAFPERAAKAPRPCAEAPRPATPDELLQLRALIEDQCGPQSAPPAVFECARGGTVGLRNLKHAGLLREYGGVHKWMKANGKTATLDGEECVCV